MRNIGIETKKNLLVITIDLKKSMGPSKSGKSTLIASTEGNTPVSPDGKTRLGLNLFKML